MEFGWAVFTKKMLDEEKASGISPEKTELDTLLDDIYETYEASIQMNLDEDEKIRKK